MTSALPSKGDLSEAREIRRDGPEAEMPPAHRFIVGGFKYLVWPAAELAFHIGLRPC